MCANADKEAHLRGLMAELKAWLAAKRKSGPPAATGVSARPYPSRS